ESFLLENKYGLKIYYSRGRFLMIFQENDTLDLQCDRQNVDKRFIVRGFRVLFIIMDNGACQIFTGLKIKMVKINNRKIECITNWNQCTHDNFTFFWRDGCWIIHHDIQRLICQHINDDENTVIIFITDIIKFWYCLIPFLQP